ncbi:MAG TPA: hemolysin family protein [Acidimicrobiales bacterium]|jgi:CBS domain containing-hemolysin-like protein|nr:hemolysin family protein [Acidimicrobiales bacterium]
MTAGALAATLALLLANAFFVAMEFAVVATPRTRIEPLAARGHRRARVALAAIRDVNPQLAGAQLGITAASLVLGFVAEPAFARVTEDVLHPIGVPDGVSHAIAFALALVIVSFAHMVVGEMIPKNIAIAQPDRTLLWLAVPNRAYLIVFRPVVWGLNATSNGLVRALGVEPRAEVESTHTADEIAFMVGASRREGLIGEVAHQLLTGALDLGGRPISSVMTPRDRVVSVARSASPAEAERIVTASGHTRLVVTGPGDVDDVLGFIHAKDLLTVPVEARDRPLPLGRVRRMLGLAADATLEDALVAMQQARAHLALVTREGQTVGIVALEDVLEALVGDIRDETDPQPALP